MEQEPESQPPKNPWNEVFIWAVAIFIANVVYSIVTGAWVP